MNLPGIYDIFKDEWADFQEIYLISDTHFNDEELFVGANRIIRDDEEYVKLINSKVGRKSVLIHLGDCGDTKYISQLRAGYKILIAGNHDAGSANYQRQQWKEKFDAEIYDKKQIIKTMQQKYPNCRISCSDLLYDIQHAPFKYYIAIADNYLFDRVYRGALIIGEKIILSHEPIEVPGMLNLHGHDHSGLSSDKRHFNICPDATGNFEPISLNKLLKEGFTSHIKSNHRTVIDKATKRAKKRGKKK